jgi:outer membrane protein OmpA-like peptidoglycan-associated protein
MKLKLFITLFICNSLCFAQSADSSYFFYFENAKFTSSQDSIQKFNTFLSKYQNCVTCSYILEGYSDKHGDEQANYKLSVNRVAFISSLIPKDNNPILKELYYGEEKSQYALNDQDYRVVKLFINSPAIEKPTKNEIKDSIITTISDKKTEKEARIEAFNVRDKAIQLKILFYPGSTALIQSSIPELEVLYQYLYENNEIKAKIVGHVCCSPEMRLSKDRAEVVYGFLVEKGIDKKRLQFIGVSNTQPLVKEVNEATQKMNRRVEVFFTE